MSKNKDMDYNGKKWKRKRAKILKRDRYIDKVAARYGKTVEATIVHHIYPSDEYPQYEWEDWNLISVSFETHNKLHNRNDGSLSKEGEALKERLESLRRWQGEKL